MMQIELRCIPRISQMKEARIVISRHDSIDNKELNKILFSNIVFPNKYVLIC